ncbi:similar to Saccharomyces cerevisiae YML047C PRM6 Pheromone- regulated protein, predicted to have 2 transmembrane segments [Maudiozyma barnettii]|uniref:Similar to Saccharomyces cerevisiae YML047C PRM6 Pheromone- regulated protein, predicted to have 2 transmembrane segments n=1 Tax=Maudiozyma barnettii TaxID=61262 RepID=A0A8H2VFY3_9SACH|nr:uncharacterized protein KABA2_04S12804 [Kazachstania barnettii]CAB4254721.1 similar to Saccharomyces cerevisiae YML047C PRM6 Pheromone- regulated protein, predicted to have 2 transmembrane segments [Kazachstania barnettii]CAD1782763.1 similar to Saccharomyces cerevisiae YML047C PRM6 Pheromone- regulated protein, predicted to have 2 transmembrane segments [Kazachstania barnettii]
MWWQVFGFSHKIDSTDINDQLFNDLDLSLFQRKNKKTLTIYMISVWGMTLLKVIHLFSDIYTCIKLLAFNTWSNEYIQPYLPFKISKWLFSGCIIFSILLLLWEGIHGLRIYQTQNVCYGYINNFARTLYCLRDYRIFCLFDKVTPSGAFQKLTFFCFFELKNCIRLIFTDSPRQVINGLTLWSVLAAASDSTTIANDSNNSDNANNSNLLQIYDVHGVISRIRIIAQTNHEEAVMLSFMLVSFLIWMLLFLKFSIAVGGSLYVCYRFQRDSQFKTVREYISITISYNLEYLIEKYKYKQFYSQSDLLESIDDSEDDSDWDMHTMSYYNHQNNYIDGELGKISFVKTPDTLYSIPSYYYK